MDWFTTVKNYYNAGYYDKEKLKVFVQKGKITAEQYKEITGIEYST